MVSKPGLLVQTPVLGFENASDSEVMNVWRYINLIIITTTTTTAIIIIIIIIIKTRFWSLHFRFTLSQ